MTTHLSDPVTMRVNAILLNGAARAYAVPRVHDEGWDPQLCANCQRVRPTHGLVCDDCRAVPGCDLRGDN